MFLAYILERTHDVSVLPSLHYSVLESNRLAEGLRAAFQTLRYRSSTPEALGSEAKAVVSAEALVIRRALCQ